MSREERYQKISEAGEDIEIARVKLATAVEAQNTRMDTMEKRAGINRASYLDLVEAATRVGENSEKLRRDVDDLLERVGRLEQHVID